MAQTQIALILTNCVDHSLFLFENSLKALGMHIVPVLISTDEGLNTAHTQQFAFVSTVSDKLSAVKAGLEYIQKNFTGAYTVVIADTDGFHTAASVKLVADEAALHPDTLILSRRSQKEKDSIERIKGIIKHTLYRRYVGINIYGETNCLKGFSSELMPKFADISDRSFDHEINLLMKRKEYDIPVLEIKTKSLKPEGSSEWIDTLHTLWIRHKNIIKFSCSSFTAFLIDYILYTAILLWVEPRINFVNLTFANIAARIVSASVNFAINRRFVFKSNQNLQKSAAQFFTLAAFILFCNSVVLNLLANILDINHYLAKILTEMFFFVFNYTIQNFVIFRKKQK